MAPRTTSIKFEIIGDPSRGVKAWQQIAAAARAAGGDMEKAGKEIEAALAKANKKQSQNAPGNLVRDNALQRLIDTAGQLPGVGQYVDQFAGSLEGMSTKALAGGAALTGLVAAAVAMRNTFLGAVEEVDAVGDALGASAKEASSIVGILRGVGLSAGEAAPGLAIFAKNVTNNADKLAQLGVVIARNADGSVDFEETLLNVAAAYQATGDGAVQAQLGTAAFGKSWVQYVDVLEASLPTLERLRGTGPDISDDDIQSVKDMKAAVNEGKTAFEEFAAIVGGPAIKAQTQLIFQPLAAGAKATSAIFHRDFAGAWDAINGKAAEAEPVFSNVAIAFARLHIAGATAAAGQRDLASAVELASSRAQAAASVFANLLNTQTTNAGAQIRFKDAVSNLAAVQTTGAQNARKYQDAQDNVAEAMGAQSRAVADGARRIADAEAQAARQIADAQEAVADARLAAARAAEDSADRVIDAERALVDAQTAAAGDDNELAGRRRVEDAQRDLERARRDQAREATDSADQIADAERDLNEAQVDGAKAVADARREAAQAQEDAAKRVADAQQRANETIDVGTVSIGNQTAKVDELVKSTFDAAFQTAAMGGSQEDVKRKVDEAKLALEQYGPQLGLTTDQVKYYKDQLDLIPPTVTTTIGIKWTSSFTGSATSAAQKGIAAVVAKAMAEQIQVPQFAGGGIFRASGGAGLAVLHDGEKVLTPEQQQNQGGVTVNFNGPVYGDDKAFAEQVARAARKGLLMGKG